jgi:hypothetical protein
VFTKTNPTKAQDTLDGTTALFATLALASSEPAPTQGVPGTTEHTEAPNGGTLEVSTAATLSFAKYPHLADRIISHAPFASLLALRGASRGLRDYIDSILVCHIVIYPDAGRRSFGTFRKGEYHRLPRGDWYTRPELLYAVRVVDLPPPPHGQPPTNGAGWGRPLGQGRGSTGGHNRGVEVTSHCSWCDRSHQRPSPFLKALAQSLHHVQIVRRWNAHSPCGGVKTRVIINFVDDVHHNPCRQDNHPPAAARELWVSGGEEASTILQIYADPPHQPPRKGAATVAVRYTSPEPLLSTELAVDVRLAMKQCEQRRGYALRVAVPHSFLAGESGVEGLCDKMAVLGSVGPVYEKRLPPYAKIIGEDEYRSWLGVTPAAVEMSPLPLPL